ncbi:MAG: hypothetical protein ACHQU0_03610 [Candidatus Paceibacteria bacterium]
MKSVAQQLTEKVATLRARGKGDAVDAILAEASEYTLEAQLHKLEEYSRSLNPAKPSVTKHNGASDNAPVHESFNESGDEVSRKQLREAAMKAFNMTEAEAEFFASDRPVNAEVAALLKDIRGGK